MGQCSRSGNSDGSIDIEPPGSDLTTPGCEQLGDAVAKNVSLTERTHLECRGDASKVLNYSQVSVENEALSFPISSTPTSGRISDRIG